MNKISKKKQRKRRHVRIRAKVKGTVQVPRLSVYRSNKHLYAQMIDDENGRTIVSSSDIHIEKTSKSVTKEKARHIGMDIAKKAKTKKITNVIFDRGGFQYNGNIKEVATGAREAGLIF